MHILIIDDDYADTELFCRCVKELIPESRVSFAYDTKSSLEYIDLLEEAPDYIFLDLKMEMENGLDCLRYLKEREKLLDCKIIIFSDYGKNENIEEYVALGAYKYIAKPINWLDFKQLLPPIFGRS